MDTVSRKVVEKSGALVQPDTTLFPSGLDETCVAS